MSSYTPTNTGTLNVFIDSKPEFNSKYTFTELIGRGCYSKVKLAYHNTTHRKVAVKIIEKAEVLKLNLYAQIFRQKDILLRIKNSLDTSSPFIVPLIECGQDFEHLYFVMEFANRGNLRQLLKTRKTLDMTQISKSINETLEFITVCILLALQSLETQGIIHGDIKPENILIDQNGYFLLADFSSSRYFNCWNHEIRGTKGYIAPEIKINDKFRLRDNKTDLYSFGTLLWELAHGTKYSNFLKNHKSTLRDSELTGESSEDSQDSTFIDPVFDELVCLLLNQNPLQRPRIQQLWSHRSLNLNKNQLRPYLDKKVSPHPFQPLGELFQFVKSYREDYSPKQKKRIYDDETDSLLSSVLLSQKKYQNLFASFSNLGDGERKGRK